MDMCIYHVQSNLHGNRDATNNAEICSCFCALCTVKYVPIFLVRPVVRLHVVVPQAVDHPRDLPLLHHLVTEELHLDVALVRALVHALLVPAAQANLPLEDGC